MLQDTAIDEMVPGGLVMAQGLVGGIWKTVWFTTSMSPRISLEYQRVLELFRTVQGRRLLWTRFGKRRRLMVAVS